MYICHLQVGIQAMYPTVTIYSTAFHPPDFVSISSCPVDTGPLHLEKKRSGLWSVEGVGLVGVELKTHVCRYLSKKKWKQIAGYWLVVEPTHLEKYGTVKNGFIFPKFRGENSKKCGRNHQPGRSPMLWASKLRRISWAANKINGGGGGS